MQWEQFEKFIEEVMEKEQIPGVAVALSKNGQPIYERGFGTRNFETNEPVTPETIFGIASITKSFTALRASNETTLVIMPLEKPIRFFIDEKNEAWALFIGLRMLVKNR